MMRQVLLGMAGVSAGLALVGCVERTITIASDPSGALVSLNDVPVGRTGKNAPLKVPFTWYGTYDVRLTLERNEGTADKPVMKRYFLHTSQAVKAPPWQWMGIDLFADAAPFEIRDDQLWTFILQPVVDPTDEDLLKRAKALQGRLGETEDLRPKEKIEAEKKAAAAAATRAAAASQPATAPASQPAKRP